MRGTPDEGDQRSRKTPFLQAPLSLRIIALTIASLAPAIAATESLDASFSTFLGSRNDGTYDSVESVKTDAQGNLYIGGRTRSDLTRPGEPGIPTTPTSLVLPSNQPPDNPCEGECGYVIKLNADREVVYGAILPLVGVQEIAVDSNGAVVVAGTFSGFNGVSPVTADAFSSDGGIFVGKISPDGSTQEYGALFRADEVHAIEIDSDGNTYIAGDVVFPGLPTTPDSVRPEFAPGGVATPSTGFLLKVNSTGTELLFGTHLGGDGFDESFGLALDGAGGAVVVGKSNSSSLFGFPASGDGFDTSYIMHVSPDGTEILDVRLFDGSVNDVAFAITSNQSGGYLVVGRTSSPDFPVSPNALQGRLLGVANGWIASLDSDLNVTGATYLGGTFTDGLLDVASDVFGNAYVVGTTFSADLLTSENAFQSQSSAYATSFFANAGPELYPVDSDGPREAFFSVVSADMASLIYSSYLGGSLTVPRGFDALTFGSTIARSQDGKIYVGGSTGTESFPTNSDAIQETFLGLFDGFVVEFSAQDIEITGPMFLPAAPVGENYEYRLEATGGSAPYTWEVVGFVLPDGLQMSDDGTISGITSNDQTEVAAYQFTVQVSDSAGHTAHRNLFINPAYPGNPKCVPGQCRLNLNIRNEFVLALPFPSRGVPPFTLDVVGELPGGVSVNESEGTFSGSVDEPGSYEFAFTVADSFGVAVTLNLLIIATDPDAPAPTPPIPPPLDERDSGGGGGSSGGGSFTLIEILLLYILFMFRDVRNLRRKRLSRIY